MNTIQKKKQEENTFIRDTLGSVKTEAQSFARTAIRRSIHNSLSPNHQHAMNHVAPTKADKEFAAAILAQDSEADKIAEEISNTSLAGKLLNEDTDSLEIADQISESVDGIANLATDMLDGVIDSVGELVDGTTDLAGEVIARAIESLVD